ncbi:metabotropic glutamate receptor 3-like [Acanthaster planci]|uniref:Metabotropic glutamate receptor 3-like n=1 Tax=Acanthaster planci TaxID=133434 RepID=A0A8B7YZS6_ACAPL|nr:metabotropic glutamate receptor 3-like [Acanthaster planci]XP_022098849.1 metabotropic glutamate receptor 3-like [Acanthaster planci]XP_022098851.1 metabotropic glutamate receptor 3-like [Acanthaster planci]XP_022098852.1 metabotropic glutamate receptor 3-like [Acanthaster planci]XP_022098853.1 metabotropic glutamate receptor 3-like [Acanthaster planci]
MEQILNCICLLMVSFELMCYAVVAVYPDYLGSVGEGKRLRVDGNIVLGGLFPIHEKGKNGSICGVINEDRGIQRLEAMLFAIDLINNDTSLLPGITLGAEIRDTCSEDTYALEQSLEFVRASLTTVSTSSSPECPAEHINKTGQHGVVAGVIGGSYSTVSIQVANLLRLFQIPQISYASTSSELTDRKRFEYFARTVPPDTLQAKAIADIIASFGWTYVSTVASDGNYGESGIYEFTKEAGLRNICIAKSEKIRRSADSETYDNIIRGLRRKQNAKVVVLFTRVEDARDLLSAAKRANLSENFIWLASDGWGAQESPVKGNEAVAEGAITIELQTQKIDKFDEYFLNLNPKTNKRNPWFKEYWEQKFKCELPDDPGEGVCARESLDDGTHLQEKKTQFVVDAVYALVKALDNMHRVVCNETSSLCDGMIPINGERLFKEFVLKVVFTDIVDQQVSFDENGNGLGRYDILNFRRDENQENHYHYVKVGKWYGQLEMDRHAVQFHPSVSLRSETNLPMSQCSLPCEAGEIKRLQDDDEICCWLCTACRPYQYVENEHRCRDCEKGYWPIKNLSGCYKLREEYMELDTLWCIVPMAFSLFGIIATCAVAVVFITHNQTPLVKASSRELSYILLLGFAACYAMTFPILMKPSVATCSIQRVGLGLSFCMCYSALLTKTNRIARIFDSASRSAQRPKYISPKSQLVICFGLVSVQLFGELVWLVVKPPGTGVHITEARNHAVLKCNISDVSLVVSLAYNMLLILCCTVYAFKTRKIPENFNEAKFIGFTMYTTCIVWLAFVPLYFGTTWDFRMQTTTLCVTVSMSATVALACLFTPKVYIIVFQPEKNVRRLNTTSTRRSHYEAPPRDVMNNHSHCGSRGKYTMRFNNQTTQYDSQDTEAETSQAFL